MSKAYDSANELEFINYDASNNRINFTVNIASNNAPIADESAGAYANAAFIKANSAFNSANNASDSWVRNQANLAYTRANNSLSANTGGIVTGDVIVAGFIRSSQSSGDEGGEIQLATAATNQSLAGNVVIDIFQNKVRIFESGGGNRGAFIDIANTTSNSVGSEISKYDSNTSSTGYFKMSVGTTAQRPGSPSAGMIRYNTTTGEPEWYDTVGNQWLKFSQASNYTVEALLVAGGGGGGGSNGGAGGGAGGYLSSSFNVTPSVSYTITVGAGGTGSPSASGSATNGGSTAIVGVLTAVGGGYGARQGQSPNTGSPGGSGGGGAGDGGSGTPGALGGSGTAGQGNDGGRGWYQNVNDGGGGGGGAGAVGGNGSTNRGGNGGAGLTWVNGSSYAGGGGGSSYTGTASTGGLGGGGNGGTGQGGGGSAGGTNTGGGGGASSSGFAGGSGIVIIRYQGTQRGSGGTIISAGGYTYHVFTGSSTFIA